MAGEERPPERASGEREADDLDDEPSGRMSWLREFVRAWAPAILVVLFIRAFIFEPFRIPSGSMVPSLLIGDHVLVTKFSYGVWLPVVRKELVDLGDPERGDIIVFRYPEDERLNYIKRVVAIPGDRVKVRNNQIFLNDEAQARTYVGRYEWIDDDCRPHSAKRYVEELGAVPHEKLTNSGLGGLLASVNEVTVPPGHVFVMGDNRDNSEDSRRWSFVRFDQIKGKAHFVWLSWDRCAGSYGELRTDRFFHGLYQEPDLPAVAGP